MAWRFVLRALQPRHRPQPVTYLVHGRPRTDPYAWMDRGSLQRELQAEARFCRRVLGTPRLVRFQTEVTQELEELCAASDVAVQEVVDGFEYWLDSGPAGHPQLWRRRAAADGAPRADHAGGRAADGSPQLVLDLAAVAARRPAAAWELLLCRPSDDGRRVACLVAADGQPDGRLLVCNTDGTTEPEDWLDGPAIATVEWTSRDTLLYVVADAKLRPCEVFEHVVGHSRDTDVRVFAEGREQRLLQLGRTKDRRLFTLLSRDKQASQAWVRSTAAPPGAPFRPLPAPAAPHCITAVEHHAGRLLLGLSGDSPGGIQVLVLEMADAVERSDRVAGNGDVLHLAKPLIPEEQVDPGWVTTDWDVFERHIVLFQRSLAAPDHRLCVLDVSAAPVNAGPPPRCVPFPPSACPHPCANQTYTANRILLAHSSLAQPLTLHSLSLPDLSSQPLAPSAVEPQRRQESQPKTQLRRGDGATAGHPPDVVFERHHVGDVGVPVTLVYRQGLHPAKDRLPALLCVYGAYGEVLSTAFQFERRWLLEHGWLLALLHVRGGGEKGAPWHEAGRRTLKRHSAVDFLSACRWLHAAGLTTPDRTAVHAFSAGALVPAAALPMLPAGERLFRSFVLESPFLDFTTMALDPNTALMAHESGEWGDAQRSEADYEAISQLCPYENLDRVEHFPDVYASVCCDDRLTPYRNALKYVSRARWHPSRPLVVLRCAPRGGHHGMQCPSEAAARIAFLHHSFGQL